VKEKMTEGADPALAVVGFCTSVMNRRWQVERTLEANLTRLRGSRSFIALCDYNSGDGLEHFVKRFEGDLKAGRLKYFRTEEPHYFHSSRAKNLAHRLAVRFGPSVLFNLDADNFISADTQGIIDRAFGPEQDRRSVLHNWNMHSSDGSFGRIALATATWLELGGYDEELKASSWEDIDLLIRCRIAGLRYVRDPRGVLTPVGNSMADRVANLEPSKSAGTEYTRYYTLCQENLVISMGRPAKLDQSQQQRFSGCVNFTEARTI
jgi:hypothetical protein